MPITQSKLGRGSSGGYFHTATLAPKGGSVGKVAATGGGCGCITGIFYLLFSGWSFDYCLMMLIGKNIPWYGDIICGLFVGSVTIPLAIVMWVLNFFGVVTPPLFPQG